MTKKPKYNNTKIIIDNIKFDSKLEANFYVYLRDNPDVHFLTLQNKYELQPKFKRGKKTIREINYIADFNFHYKGQNYVIDSKGMKTAVFLIKQKMLLYKHPDLNFYAISSVKKLKELLEDNK